MRRDDVDVRQVLLLKQHELAHQLVLQQDGCVLHRRLLALMVIHEKPANADQSPFLSPSLASLLATEEEVRGDAVQAREARGKREEASVCCDQKGGRQLAPPHAQPDSPALLSSALLSSAALLFLSLLSLLLLCS